MIHILLLLLLIILFIFVVFLYKNNENFYQERIIIPKNIKSVVNLDINNINNNITYSSNKLGNRYEIKKFVKIGATQEIKIINKFKGSSNYIFGFNFNPNNSIGDFCHIRLGQTNNTQKKQIILNYNYKQSDSDTSPFYFTIKYSDVATTATTPTTAIGKKDPEQSIYMGKNNNVYNFVIIQITNGLLNIYVNSTKKSLRTNCIDNYNYKTDCLRNHCNYNDKVKKCEQREPMDDYIFNLNKDGPYDIEYIEFSTQKTDYMLGNVIFYNIKKSIEDLVKDVYLENDSHCIKHLTNKPKCDNDPKCYFDSTYNKCYSIESKKERVKPYYFRNRCNKFKLEDNLDFDEKSNIINCLEKCINAGCGKVQCQEMCVDCTPYDKEKYKWSEDEKQRVCPWYAKIKITDTDKPEPPKVRGFPGDAEVVIEWRKPYDNGVPITHYIIEVSKTNNKNSSKSVNMIDVKNNNNEIISYPCKNLVNNTNYDITVKAVNNIGMSLSSENIVMMPQGESNDYTIDNVLTQLNTEKEDYFKTQYNCKDIKNLENHRLDNIGVNEINIKHQLSGFFET